MIYVYENAKGERREVQASMKSPPPEHVIINTAHSLPGSEGDYLPDTAQMREDLINQTGRSSEEVERMCFHRVYGDFIINRQTVSGKFGYHSRTLPLNIPGEETNKIGQVLVKSKAHARELCRKTGFEQYD